LNPISVAVRRNSPAPIASAVGIVCVYRKLVMIRK
jgi:hypothetical protein